MYQKIVEKMNKFNFWNKIETSSNSETFSFLFILNFLVFGL
jgi:hypothetical protein